MTMRLLSLGLGAAILAAVPAFAQENTVTNETSVTSTNEVMANAAPTAPPSPTTAAVTPGNQAAPVPETAPPSTDTGSVVVQKDRTFPWGVLGLVGLIGLFGRRRRS
jgi:MYXO-CTERM domain-containing protein